MTIPPTATAKRHREPGGDARVDALVLEQRVGPGSRATHRVSQRQYWAKKPSLRWSCAVILAISAGVALAPPARARAGLPGQEQDEREDAEGDEEQQQNR